MSYYADREEHHPYGCGHKVGRRAQDLALLRFGSASGVPTSPAIVGVVAKVATSRPMSEWVHRRYSTSHVVPTYSGATTMTPSGGSRTFGPNVSKDATGFHESRGVSAHLPKLVIAVQTE